MCSGNGFIKTKASWWTPHVIRLSQRLGLTKHKDPVKIELDLVSSSTRALDGLESLAHLHGRRRCYARKPDCSNCEVFRLLPKRKGFSAELDRRRSED